MAGRSIVKKNFFSSSPIFDTVLTLIIPGFMCEVPTADSEDHGTGPNRDRRDHEIGGEIATPRSQTLSFGVAPAGVSIATGRLCVFSTRSN